MLIKGDISVWYVCSTMWEDNSNEREANSDCCSEMSIFYLYSSTWRFNPKKMCTVTINHFIAHNSMPYRPCISMC